MRKKKRKIRSWLTRRSEQSVELLVQTLQVGDLCSEFCGLAHKGWWYLSSVLFNLSYNPATLLFVVLAPKLLVQRLELGILGLKLCLHFYRPVQIDNGSVSSLIFKKIFRAISIIYETNNAIPSTMSRVLNTMTRN